MNDIFEGAGELFNQYGNTFFTLFFIWFGICITYDLLSFGIFKAFSLLNMGSRK